MNRIKDLYRRNQEAIDQWMSQFTPSEKPDWYQFLIGTEIEHYEDDQKWVFWDNIVEEGFDDDGVYYRRVQMESFKDTSQKNPDIPRPEAFADQGLRQPKVWKDTWSENRSGRYWVKNHSRRSMDQADFEDRCIVRNGKVLALYQKSLADMQGPYHLRPEVIMEWFNRDQKFPICSPEDAATLSDAWGKLNLDAHSVRCLIFGYRNWEKHENLSGLRRARKTLAKYFEDLTGSLPVLYADEDGQREIEQNLVDEIRQMQDAGARWQMEDEEVKDYAFMRDPADNMFFLGTYDDTDFNWVKGRIWYERDEVDPANSAFDQPGPARDTVFSAAPLYWGAEGLTHEFLTKIRFATLKELLNIEKSFRRRKVRGRWLPPKFNYLTKSQKDMGWRYINDRKAQLMADVEPHLSEAAQQTYEHIKDCDDMDDFDRVVARTLSHVNGRTYQDAWQTIRFRKPRLEEQVFLRTRLNEKEKALYK